MRLNLLLGVTATFALVPLSAAAQVIHVCVAEEASQCDGSYDPRDPPRHIGCANINQWAAEACRAHNGPPKFIINPGVGGPGKRCGWRLAHVVCQ
jgi:hypothetical protein